MVNYIRVISSTENAITLIIQSYALLKLEDASFFMLNLVHVDSEANVTKDYASSDIPSVRTF